MLLLSVQILLFNELTLFDISRPFPYIMAILLLPIKLPKWQGLVISFIVGYVVDIFSYSYGIHAGASVLIFYLRDFYLHNILGITDDFEEETPHLINMGTSTFVLYVTGMVFVHQLMVSILAELSFSEVLRIILRTFVNTLFTVLLILIIEIIFFYQRASKR